MPDAGERPVQPDRDSPSGQGDEPHHLADVTAEHLPEPNAAPRPRQAPPNNAPASASRSAADPPRFIPGAMIAERYRVVSLLGRGGMGEVYRAEDLRLGQSVAIKLLPRELEHDARRLQQLHAEVRLAREVAHANVARVYDIGDADGRHFLTMEFVDGEDLASLLRRVGRPNAEKSIEIARQICAGLAALHDRGLLHRDLKPANIMLDERGTVRIMDFGLAQRADDARAGGREGTPAYMAPEQWSGEPLTRATDLYAVGLILYELFTGRSAISAKTLDDYRRWHTSGSVDSLSDSLASIDPAVERVIVRCLEKSPELRPPSALAVAAMLPGGDPIAAALAAGDTPSPEMVAAAGRAARISPAFAFPVAGVFLIALVVWLMVPSQFRPWQLITLPKPPVVLQDRAEEIMAALGNSEPARGSGWGFVVDREALAWLERTEGGGAMAALKEGLVDPLLFYARRGPRPLVATNSYCRITPDDPPFDRSGMSLVMLDPLGRLRSLEVVPERDAPTPAAAMSETKRVAPELWTQLFINAGLTLDAFDSAAPQRRPRFFADEVFAWQERSPSDPAHARRVEAAALNGQVTQFEVLGPWKQSEPLEQLPAAEDQVETASERAASVTRQIGWLLAALLFGLIILIVVLAVRHVRAGRGDRRGANTIALAVCSIAFLRWMLLCDPSFSPLFINAMLSQGIALALFAASLAWLVYMALEPFTRRIWPSTMITWQRLLQGRLTDPLLGRDLLIGACVGVLILLLGSLGLAIETRLGLAPVLIFGDSWTTPWLYGLAGGRRVIGLLLLAVQTGLLGPMSFLLVLVFSRLLLRRPWVAAIPLAAIFGLLQIASSASIISGIIVGSLTAVMIVVVLVRYGLVAMLGAQIVATMLTAFPVTTDVSAWYFSSGLVGVVGAMCIAGLGLWSAVAGRPAPAWERPMSRRSGTVHA